MIRFLIALDILTALSGVAALIVALVIFLRGLAK